MNPQLDITDDQVARALLAALATEERWLGPVDLDSLSPRGRTTRRRQSYGWVGAAAATVLVVGGVAALGASMSHGEPTAVSPAAGGPTADSPSASPTDRGVQPTAPAVALPPTRVSLPRDAFLDVQDLGFQPDLHGVGDRGDTPEGSPDFRSTTTALCGEGVSEDGDASVVGSRQVDWFTDHSGPSGRDRTVSEAIRVHRHGPDAQVQMAYLRRALGSCSYAGAVWRAGSAAGVRADETVVGYRAGGLSEYEAWGVARLDNVTVGVMTDGRTPAAVQQEVRRLLGLAVQRYEAHPAATPDTQ